MPRPSSKPSVASGHAFAANMTHAWTFHATGNTSGAGIDDIVGSAHATNDGATLSDTLGLDCTVQTARATLGEITVLPPYSMMFRAKQDTNGAESIVAGRTADNNYFLWLDQSGTFIICQNGSQFSPVSGGGGSGGTSLTDYCITCSASGAGATFSLYKKLASNTTWVKVGTSAINTGIGFKITDFGAGYSGSSFWLQGELEYFLTFNIALSVNALNESFSDPYAIFNTTGPAVFSSGTASTLNNGNAIATVICTAATGGVSPYTYQWQRSTTLGTGFANISGATSLTRNDTGLTNGTTYYYRCVATDSVSATVTSNVTMATPITPSPTAAGTIVFEGDSWTYGAYATSGAGTVIGSVYERHVMDMLPNNWVGINAGTNGNSWSALESQAAALDATNYNTSKAHNVLVVLCGINDISIGISGEAVYASTVSYCQARRNVGWKVLLISLPPAATGSGSANYLPRRNSANALYDANWRSFADGYVAIHLDDRIGKDGDQTNLAYFHSDQTHLNDAGYQILGNLVAGALGSVVYNGN